MVQITTILALAFTACSAVSATQITVNVGCVYLGIGQGLCAGGASVDINFADVYGCVDGSASPQTSSCRMQTEIPNGWGDVFYGADNCLYGTDNTQLGCSQDTAPVAIPNVY